ncbi:unnamed protein product [Caenorhabditis auriculariae]|uniref:DUF7622 domain-containing protein n=1 Tax=Caenorhabditis auriculariae TaxID=2777116 RepID=A0A8S1HFF5_9PELO|nr:unnamed protein product [Caenorhabditis auriculariae]
MIFLLLLFFAPPVGSIECFQCESDFQNVLRCKEPCSGDQCVVWKWKKRDGLAIRQGCLKGIDERWTSKPACRTNHLGASLCVCSDGDMCNRVERAENAARPLPTIRLPAVECQSKVASTSFIGPRKEHSCTSNYCHASKTETFTEDTAPDVLSIYNCGDIPEFDFDVRLKSSAEVAGLYVNGCYRVQLEKRQVVTDCVCSKNNCNSVIPVIVSGTVRCYMGQNFQNISQVYTDEFCDGDYCLIQNDNGKISKGCISVNERNSYSHIRSGHRRILGTDQWLCQAHLCNYDPKR